MDRYGSKYGMIWILLLSFPWGLERSQPAWYYVRKPITYQQFWCSKCSTSLSFFRGPSNSKHSCFYWRVWDWHAYFPIRFLQYKFNFSFLVQLSTWCWKCCNLIFLVRCIQLNHFQYTALLTTHLWYFKGDML